MTDILCDVDGVVCDWLGGVARLYGRSSEWAHERAVDYFSLDAIFEEPWGDIAARIDAAGPGWWAELRPYRWASALLEALSDIAPVILATRCGSFRWAAEGKRTWFVEYCPSMPYFLAGPNIERLADFYRPGRVTVDDKPPTVGDVELWGERYVVFPQPYNGATGDWQDVCERTRRLFARRCRCHGRCCIDHAAGDFGGL